MMIVNRRSLFKFLAAIPIVGPALLRGGLVKPEPVPGRVMMGFYQSDPAQRPGYGYITGTVNFNDVDFQPGSGKIVLRNQNMHIKDGKVVRWTT